MSPSLRAEGTAAGAASVDHRAVDAAHNGLLAVLGLTGLALAVALRVRLAGVDGARSAPAGLAFGAGLIVVAATLGLRRPAWGPGQWLWGLGGAAVLCLVPAWRWVETAGGAAGVADGLRAASGPISRLAVWAGVVAFVAVAEEAVLRGAVFEALTHWRGENVAIAVTAAAFALLHVPVYGWAVLPLDLAVGVGLGVLRVLAGSVTAPAIAHLTADLAGWFLR